MTKKEFYVVGNGVDENEIAEKLFLKFNEKIVRNILGSANTINCAMWAGSLSAISMHRDCSMRGPFWTTAGAVYELCAAVARTDMKEICNDSQACVSFFRAMKNLVNTQHYEEISDLVDAVDSQENIDGAFDVLLKSDEKDSVHRANQLVGSYLNYVQKVKKREVKRKGGWSHIGHQEYTVSDYVERKFLDFEKALHSLDGFGWDAGNWWFRAENVIVKDKYREEIEKKRSYLDFALDRIHQNPIPEATWKDKVNESIHTLSTMCSNSRENKDLP